MFSSSKTPKELRELRAAVETEFPRRTLWRSNTRGTLFRITGCTLEADTYTPRIQFVMSGTATPSYNLTLDQFKVEFERYMGGGITFADPD